LIPSRPGPLRERGITLIELLIVALVAGVLLSLGGIGVRGFLQRTAERSARSSVEQALWGGATLASARGERVVLWRAGPNLELRSDDGRLLRRFDVAAADLDLPDGASLIFTPPGVIDVDSLAAWPAPLVARSRDGNYHLDLSLIGEVRWR
jgi:hypothetical protein